jgi:hypothetical protein
MKGKRFEIFHRSNRLTRELKAIREQAFPRAFHSLYERCKRCGEGDRDYWY